MSDSDRDDMEHSGEDQLFDSLRINSQALLQQFWANKVLSRADLERHISKVNRRFSDQDNQPLGDIRACLGTINRSIKFFGMEIVSIEMPDHIVYYGLINKEADEIAKQFGSTLEDWELEVLKTLIEALGKKPDHQIVRGEVPDICAAKRDNEYNLWKNYTEQGAERLVDALVAERWLLASEDQLNLSLGPRSHMELKEYIEGHGVEGRQIIYY